MLTIMKRRMAILLSLLCIAMPIFPFSLMEDTGWEQPFDSERELAKRDFSAALAENQLEWARQCTITLFTEGEGDPLYAWFGHSALIVTQPNGSRIMYDYGIFDTSQKHFYLNFARGRMLYSVFASNAEWRIDEAIAKSRNVREIDLDFTPEEKFAIISFLQDNIKEGNNTYLYHFYRDNCATRIRDIVDAATGGRFRTWAEAQDGGGTFRSLAERHMAHSPLIAWFLNFLQSKNVDKRLNRYEAMFLPDELHQALLDFTYADGTTLVSKHTVVNDTSDHPVRFTPDKGNRNYDGQYALVGIILALANCMLLLRSETSKTARHLWGLYNGLLLAVLSVSGSLLLFMMAFSNMDMTWFNETIVFINPLLLIPMVCAFRAMGNEKARGHLLRCYRILTMAIAVLLLAKGLYPEYLYQDNMAIIFTVLPIFATGFLRVDLGGHGKGKTKEVGNIPDDGRQAKKER